MNFFLVRRFESFVYKFTHAANNHKNPYDIPASPEEAFMVTCRRRRREFCVSNSTSSPADLLHASPSFRFQSLLEVDREIVCWYRLMTIGTVPKPKHKLNIENFSSVLCRRLDGAKIPLIINRSELPSLLHSSLVWRLMRIFFAVINGPGSKNHLNIN